MRSCLYMVYRFVIYIFATAFVGFDGCKSLNEDSISLSVKYSNIKVQMKVNPAAPTLQS